MMIALFGHVLVSIFLSFGLEHDTGLARHGHKAAKGRLGS